MEFGVAHGVDEVGTFILVPDSAGQPSSNLSAVIGYLS